MVHSISVAVVLATTCFYILIFFVEVANCNSTTTNPPRAGPPPIPDKISEESKAFLSYVYGRGKPPPFTPDARRNATKEFHLAIGGVFHNYKGKIVKMSVPSNDVQGGIPVWVYKPNGRPSNPAVAVHFHGGGFTTGSPEIDDVPCKTITTQIKCIIVSVAYRLAPENKFPASHDDGETVLRWVIKNKASLGGPDSKIGAMGTSSGGNIAASIVHDVPGVDFQILITPSTDITFGQQSYKDFESGYFLSLQTMMWFRNMWIDYNVTNITDPRCSPLLRPSFKDLPQAMNIVTGCDVLRDEGLEYGEALKNAGVDVRTLYLNNTIHMFYHLPGVFNQTATSVYKEIANFIGGFQEKDEVNRASVIWDRPCFLPLMTAVILSMAVSRVF